MRYNVLPVDVASGSCPEVSLWDITLLAKSYRGTYPRSRFLANFVLADPDPQLSVRFRRSSFLEDISEPNNASAALLKATIIWQWRDSYFRWCVWRLCSLVTRRKPSPALRWIELTSRQR